MGHGRAASWEEGKRGSSNSPGEWGWRKVGMRKLGRERIYRGSERQRAEELGVAEELVCGSGNCRSST